MQTNKDRFPVWSEEATSQEVEQMRAYYGPISAARDLANGQRELLEGQVHMVLWRNVQRSGQQKFCMGCR